MRLFQEFDQDLKKLKAKYESGKGYELLQKQNYRSQATGKAIGEIYTYMLFPETMPAELANERADARLDLIRLGFAVEVYFGQNGRYPETLADLVPDYAKAIPHDPATGKTLIYRQSARGALIYSVGNNHQDDQGQTTWEGNAKIKGADDIAVRVGTP
jgi:hypothetical protein